MWRGEHHRITVPGELVRTDFDREKAMIARTPQLGRFFRLFARHHNLAQRCCATTYRRLQWVADLRRHESGATSVRSTAIDLAKLLGQPET
jgi:hypothetical protein